MKRMILKDEYNALKWMIENKNWISVIKYIKEITGIELLRECKELVDRYRVGDKVDLNILSEFEIPEDDITILRMVAIKEVRKLDREWSNLSEQFRTLKALFESKFNALLDEIQEQRNKISKISREDSEEKEE
jgi:hypothetical protein